MPFGNVGKMKSYGADGNASFTHAFNKETSFTVRGNFTYSKNNVQNWEEANPKYPYQEASDYPLNAIRGYQAIGLFKDWDDVRNSPAQFGNLMPGDIKYRDVNGDGVINSDDRVPPVIQHLSFADVRLWRGVQIQGHHRGRTVQGIRAKTDFFHVGNGRGTGYVPFYNGVNGNVLTIASNRKTGGYLKSMPWQTGLIRRWQKTRTRAFRDSPTATNENKLAAVGLLERRLKVPATARGYCQL